MTFDQAAEAYIRQHGSGWKNADHAAQWRSIAEKLRLAGHRPACRSPTSPPPHVMKVLDPIWQEKTGNGEPRARPHRGGARLGDA